MAAELLIENRCSQVMILGIKPSMATVAQRRFWSCKERLEQAGIRTVLIEPISDLSSFSSVKKVVHQYMGIYNQVDGIFTEDVEALCCIREAKTRGKFVPRDIKIVGYDGSEMALISTPEITTIVQNAQEIAHATVDVLLKRICNEPVEREYLTPVTLRKGGTTL